MPLSTIRARTCDGLVTPVTLDHHGVVLDVGRTRRVATRAQRRALRVMYPTCAIPGCRVRFDHTAPHHVVWWRHGGRTDLTNLLPLCSKHHHAVHEGGWRLELERTTRRLTVTMPDVTQLIGAVATSTAPIGHSQPTIRAG